LVGLNATLPLATAMEAEENDGENSQSTTTTPGSSSRGKKHNTNNNNNIRWNLEAGLAHGDAMDYEYMQTLPRDMLDLLVQSSATSQRLTYLASMQDKRHTIVICHSEPGAWSVPTPRYDSANPCPPTGNTSDYHKVIGRTMFETDRLPQGWDVRLNAMDEIWVPTHHHQQIFQRDGVTVPVRVVGQGIDTQRVWNPDSVSKPMDWTQWLKRSSNYPQYCAPKSFKFLSVFKWENRKGPELLLKSFWKAFPPRPRKSKVKHGVCLILVTSLYHDEPDRITNELRQHWNEALGRFGLVKDKNNTNNNNHHDTDNDPPQGVVLWTGLALDHLVKLYASVDAFVLPSRGEGWGRPYMEAMSMGLPVLATNWSGPTEFIRQEYGYLIPLDKDAPLVDAHLEAFPHHQWAQPNATALVELMQYVAHHPDEAQAKGRAAREYIVEKWSHTAVAEVVVDHLYRLIHEEKKDGQQPQQRAGGGQGREKNEEL